MRADTIGRNRDQRTAFEIHRLCEVGERGIPRPPLVEEFGGLDRARIAALGYALDGPTSTGDRLTGRVEVYRLRFLGERLLGRDLVDVLDERVAFRVLNELSLPHADALAVPVERLQAETDRLARLGF